MVGVQNTISYGSNLARIELYSLEKASVFILSINRQYTEASQAQIDRGPHATSSIFFKMGQH